MKNSPHLLVPEWKISALCWALDQPGAFTFNQLKVGCSLTEEQADFLLGMICNNGCLTVRLRNGTYMKRPVEPERLSEEKEKILSGLYELVFNVGHLLPEDESGEMQVSPNDAELLKHCTALNHAAEEKRHLDAIRRYTRITTIFSVISVIGVGFSYWVSYHSQEAALRAAAAAERQAIVAEKQYRLATQNVTSSDTKK